MQFIRDIYARKQAARQPVISFEFFPPKTDEGLAHFFDRSLPALLALKPDYCSVTYGAGGSTRDKTLMIVDRIQREFGLTAMAHLTCVNSTRDQIRQIADQARGLGIHNLLALRGDPPAGAGDFRPAEGGFEFASQLVAFLREFGGFCIGAAGFPEGHIACKEGKHADWRHLKAKIDGGADFVLTQLFFDNADYFEFRDYLADGLGVKVPLVPGIIPILSGSQIKRFTALCGAALPEQLVADLERLGDNDEAAIQYGIDYATRQCAELLRAGAPGIHFYTLNRVRSTAQILSHLGLAPASPASPARTDP
ncbi:MAG: methylenetetrahydrofolate reductase [NAD(P)H] [Verrucomicrobia bacterium]|nr:methylenetetrahydrofolate reductase [NAD(P)H] [Verrucomicrobiota bacterium]